MDDLSRLSEIALADRARRFMVNIDPATITPIYDPEQRGEGERPNVSDAAGHPVDPETGERVRFEDDA